jgi:hypothetical protein
MRKAEIGALLSALTFHGQNNLLDHNIGSAKPLGYGRIKISEKLGNSLKYSFEDYLLTFEELIKTKHPNWLRSEALKELYAMSIDPLKDFLLKYPQIELPNVPKKDANEFLKYEVLLPYSKQTGGGFRGIRAKQEEKRRQQHKLAEQKQKKEQRRLHEELQKQKDKEDKKRKEEKQAIAENLSKNGYKIYLKDFDTFSDGRNFIEKFKKKAHVKEADYEDVRAFIKRCIGAEDQKDWSNFRRNMNWKKVSSWVGKNLSQQWFNEIIKDK